MKPSLTLDSSRLHLSLRRLQLESGKSCEEVLKERARSLCVSLAKFTQPFGLGDSGRGAIQGKKAVKRDIEKVFATKTSLFAWVKEKNWQHPKLGQRLATLLSEGDWKAITYIFENFSGKLPSLPIISAPDFSLHRAARDNRGRVKGTFRAIITNEKRLQEYIKQVQLRVGYTKGGWAAASRQLGGNARAIPQWIKRHKSIGSVVDQSKAKDVAYIVVINAVAWANTAISETGRAAAFREEEQKLVARLQILIGINARKAGFR